MTDPIAALEAAAKAQATALAAASAVACDLVINQILVEAGYTLPDGALMPGRGPYRDLPTGLSAEEYYARLLDHLLLGGGE